MIVGTSTQPPQVMIAEEEQPAVPETPSAPADAKAETLVQKITTVAGLMDRFTKAWVQEKSDFDFQPDSFNCEGFTLLLSEHAKRFQKEDVTSDHFGFIEKFDLDPSQNPRIYVRADLHGDLKSLIENLRSLKVQGLLNENYQCKTGVHLVFLGDYCDRGCHGTQILETLIRLRDENPRQVHLIRGNHEYTVLNKAFGRKDKFLKELVEKVKGENALNAFYETMSLTSYFSVDVKEEEQREYIQCTHGLFEPSVDPAPLLDQMTTGGYLPVAKKRELCERIKKIAEGESDLAESAKRVVEIVKKSTWLEPNLTAYNWGDPSQEIRSYLGGLGNRTYKVCAEDITHCLALSSENHKVVMMLRGHGHRFQHLKNRQGKILVTTLPVGMDSAGYRNQFPGQMDRAYILYPSTKVDEWKKRSILRFAGQEATETVSELSLLTSDAFESLKKIGNK